MAELQVLADVWQNKLLLSTVARTLDWLKSCPELPKSLVTVTGGMRLWAQVLD
jgi:hypothetical protein